MTWREHKAVVVDFDGRCALLQMRTGEQVSEHGAISSLLFYAWSHSRNFRPSEIRAWMLDAGFAEVTVHHNERSPWRVVVVGRR